MVRLWESSPGRFVMLGKPLTANSLCDPHTMKCMWGDSPASQIFRELILATSRRDMRSNPCHSLSTQQRPIAKNANLKCQWSKIEAWSWGDVPMAKSFWWCSDGQRSRHDHAAHEATQVRTRPLQPSQGPRPNFVHLPNPTRKLTQHNNLTFKILEKSKIKICIFIFEFWFLCGHSRNGLKPAADKSSPLKTGQRQRAEQVDWPCRSRDQSWGRCLNNIGYKMIYKFGQKDNM